MVRTSVKKVNKIQVQKSTVQRETNSTKESKGNA
jgi:hypothetical protein